MRKLKVATIVGTRPEIIRLSRVIDKFDNYFDHTLIHTGQSYDYELSQIFFDDLEVRTPDVFLNAAGETALSTIAAVISAADQALRDCAPDAVLVLGDTNSSFALLAAKKLKIPTFHMEAGNRCFDERVPEEINRRIVDHFSDINICYSDPAREHLLNEGLPPERCFAIGSPMFEVLNFYDDKIAASDALERMGLERGKFFIVSFHREENVDSSENLTEFANLLAALCDRYGYPVILSTHPRTKKRLTEFDITLPDLVQDLKPFAFSDYVRLQLDAAAVLSDSGTVSEEASILGLRALNLREAHERHEAMEGAPVMMVGRSADRALNALAMMEKANSDWSFPLPPAYNVADVSEKVARIVLSYTDVVNRDTWRKDL